jgi:ABC-type glutathione transport system ATPase component
MENLVEIRDLKVEATTDSGRRVEIIKGVSLDIAQGEIVALIGESGSGKTTIALTLMGYTRAGCRISGGSVCIAGNEMVSLNERERAAIRGTEVATSPDPPLRIARQNASSISDRGHPHPSTDAGRGGEAEGGRTVSGPLPA